VVFIEWDDVSVSTTTLFHTTPAAEAILRDGFRCAAGDHGFAMRGACGVFLSDTPATWREGASGRQVLAVVLDEDIDLTQYAIVESSRAMAEWCLPATLLNERAQVRLLSHEEVTAIG
jgi:hypothetical protein